MVAVLNKRWLSQGWRAMDLADSEPMALVFIEAMNRHEIPYQNYHALYIRAMDLRARRLTAGLRCEDFSADLMIACWPQLKQDLYEQDVAAGRILTATAMTQCLRCYGTGLETIFDENGKKLGVRRGCKHEHVDESDPYGAGFDDVVDALRRAVPPRTALDICRQVQRDLARDYLRAETPEQAAAAWEASRTWAHAAKYVKEHDGHA